MAVIHDETAAQAADAIITFARHVGGDSQVHRGRVREGQAQKQARRRLTSGAISAFLTSDTAGASAENGQAPYRFSTSAA